MLTLLRGERLLPDAQQSLRRYLERSAAGATTFDAAVIDATLYGVPVHDPDRLIEETFAGAEQPSSERKRMALAAVLAVVGPEPFHVDSDSDAFNHRGEVPWTRLRLMAIWILNADPPVAPELTARLLRMTEEGQEHGVWEKHVFSHLFALLALHQVLPGHPAIQRGVGHLAACQSPDGGMPFVVSEEIFATATAGLALALAGVEPAPVRRMADYLAAEQTPDGGWSFAEGVRQTDVDTTTHVLMFLHLVDPVAYRSSVLRAREFLWPGRHPSAGFPPTCRAIPPRRP